MESGQGGVGPGHGRRFRQERDQRLRKGQPSREQRDQHVVQVRAVGAARADIAAIPAHPYKQQERFPAPFRVWRLAPHPPQKIVLIVPDCTQRTVAIAERETGNRFRALVFRWIAALPFGHQVGHTICRQ